MSPEAASARSRSQIWVLIAVFFAPLAIAFVMYYGLDGWRPGGRTNHGELIDPARPLPQAALTTADGAQLAPDFLLRKWNVVFIGAGACDARCREALVLMRQTRLALNDDMTRIQRVFFAAGECCDQAYLEREHAGLVVIPANGAAAQVVQQFPQPQEGRIYIVDPLGNLMMSYPPASPPKGLLTDLKKLLKLSHIG